MFIFTKNTSIVMLVPLRFEGISLDVKNNSNIFFPGSIQSRELGTVTFRMSPYSTPAMLYLYEVMNRELYL